MSAKKETEDTAISLLDIAKKLDSVCAEVRKIKDTEDRHTGVFLQHMKTFHLRIAERGKKLPTLALFLALGLAGIAEAATKNWTPWKEAEGYGTVRIEGSSTGPATTLRVDALVVSNSVLIVGGMTNTGAVAFNGNVTLGDSAVADSHTINGNLTQKGDVSIISTNGTWTNAVKSTATGTITLNRPTAGAVTVTATDSDATANLVVLGGGNSSVTIGDDRVGDSVVLYGDTTVGGTITLLSTNAASTNTIASTAVGTVTLGRSTSGTVTLTSVDNDANAALTVAAGGTGATTLGDADSATTVTGSSVNLLAAATIGSLGIAAGPSSTEIMVQYYSFTSDASHTVATQALTKAYGSGVTPIVIAAYTETGATNSCYASTVASNSVNITGDVGIDMNFIVIGPMP